MIKNKSKGTRLLSLNLSHLVQPCAVLSRLVVSNSQLIRLLCPWGFSRQENWSGLPCPSLGDLPSPGIKASSPTLQADSLPSESPAAKFLFVYRLVNCMAFSDPIKLQVSRGRQKKILHIVVGTNEVTWLKARRKPKAL